MNRAGFISTVTAGLVILLAMAFLPTVLRCWARISAAPPAHTPEGDKKRKNSVLPQVPPPLPVGPPVLN